MYKLYGLIGKSLGHSFSASFFKDYFEKNNIDAQYTNFELAAIEDIQTLFNQNLAGLNVTFPYKESVLPYLDRLDETAAQIGAVNVIAFENGEKVGYNTDAYGFAQSIKPFLTFEHERALIFGTGGASKAVAHVFKQIGLDVFYISRNGLEANGVFNYEDINSHMLHACKVLVNCTPIGTFPNVTECIELPFEHLTPAHLVIDLVYNPAETELMKRAKKQGAAVMNGLSMLQHQALKSYEIWTR
ncbi:MAG: shikimate dehydrogenase family protein [Sphingomonadales bacterium]